MRCASSRTLPESAARTSTTASSTSRSPTPTRSPTSTGVSSKAASASADSNPCTRRSRSGSSRSRRGWRTRSDGRSRRGSACAPVRAAARQTLKLRKRRGLLVTVTLLTLVPQVLAYGGLAILHAANPDHHGPAGGIANLGGGISVLILLGSVAAIIVGAACGADDVNAGVFRELVVTGRSRLALFGARIPGGLLYLLPFVALAYALSALVSGLGNGDLRAPSTALLVESGLWVLANAAFYFVIALGLACVTGSRAYTIGILIAWRTIVSHILTAISALGAAREAVRTSASSGSHQKHS